MKKLFLLLTIAAAMWQGLSTVCFCQDVDLGIVWQRKMFPTRISFAKFSADGNFIYCAVGNNIQKMDARTGEWISNFDNSLDGIWASAIYGMDISKTGNIIVTLGGEIWDTRTEQFIKKTPFKCGVTTISPDESYVLLGFRDSILVYDWQQDKVIKSLKLKGVITAIKISHDGKYFATGSYYYDDWAQHYNQELILWETGTWKPIDTLEYVENSGSWGYRHVRFSNDDKYLAAVRESYIANVYDLEIGGILKSSDKRRKCFNLVMLPDNNLFLIFYGDWSGYYELELHDIFTKLKSYHYLGDIIETYGNQEDWKVFYGGDIDNFWLFKKITTGIEDQKYFDKPIKIIVDDNKILIESIEFKEIINITISDILGKEIYTENLFNIQPNSKNVLKAVLPSGFYICNVKAGDKEYSQKIEIVR